MLDHVFNGYEFKNKALLEEALTHPSLGRELEGRAAKSREVRIRHYERLEFLGDAVLELVVTDFLYKQYPDIDEGILTAYRSSLVRTESISEAARTMGMNELLLLSKGESKDQGKARDYILANTFESFVGAVYLDQGYDVARKVIADALFDNILHVIDNGTWKDAKSRFQELAQEKYSETPRYELISAVGPDHQKKFIIAVYVGEKECARGTGKSKQEAQQDAAAQALEKEA